MFFQVFQENHARIIKYDNITYLLQKGYFFILKVTLEAMRFHKHSSSQFSPEIFQSRVDQTIVPAINYDQIPMEEANWSQLKIKIHLRRRNLTLCWSKAPGGIFRPHLEFLELSNDITRFARTYFAGFQYSFVNPIASDSFTNEEQVFQVYNLWKYEDKLTFLRLHVWRTYPASASWLLSSGSSIQSPK